MSDAQETYRTFTITIKSSYKIVDRQTRQVVTEQHDVLSKMLFGPVKCAGTWQASELNLRAFQTVVAIRILNSARETHPDELIRSGTTPPWWDVDWLTYALDTVTEKVYQ